MKKAAWHFVSEEARREFGDHPERLFESAVVVKENPARQVLKSGGLFLKLDHRVFHSFRLEVDAARQLNEAGFDTVEMIACGKLGGDHALLTRELAGAVDCDAFLHSRKPSPEMLDALTDLVRRWVVSPFLHRDFHGGNLLYVSGENRFVLVDLHAVRLKSWLNDRPDYEAARLLLLPRRWLTRTEMLAMIEAAGIPEPERFYAYAMKKDAQILHGEWTKRKRQILSGYPKFSRREGERLISADTLLQQPERVPCAVEYFLAHHLLNVVKIPHRQVGEFDLKSQKALLSPLPSGISAPASALCAEMMDRLALYGIQSTPEHWSALPDEPLPVLTDLTPVAEAIQRWEKSGL